MLKKKVLQTSELKTMTETFLIKLHVQLNSSINTLTIYE